LISSICCPVSLVLSLPMVNPAFENERSEEAEVAGIAKYLAAKLYTVETVICFPLTIRPRVSLHAVGVHLLHSFQKRNSFLLWIAFWFSNPLTRKYCNYEIRFWRDSESQGFEILFWASLPPTNNFFFHCKLQNLPRPLSVPELRSRRATCDPAVLVWNSWNRLDAKGLISYQVGKCTFKQNWARVINFLIDFLVCLAESSYIATLFIVVLCCDVTMPHSCEDWLCSLRVSFQEVFGIARWHAMTFTWKGLWLKSTLGRPAAFEDFWKKNTNAHGFAQKFLWSGKCYRPS